MKREILEALSEPTPRPLVEQAAAALGGAEGWRHGACLPVFPLTPLSLFCVEDRSTVLLGMLGPDSERPQSRVRWSHPHHFPPEEKEETLLRVSRLLFSYLRWLETHPHRIYGREWPPASTTTFEPIRRTWPERTSLHTEAPSPPCEHPKHSP